jgi:type VI secretion system secreted protein Hcp
MPALDRLLLVVVALLALMPTVGRAQTPGGGMEFYVLIEGTKQGLFANESVRSSHANRVVGLNFDYLVKVPRDATGAPSGRRQHGPVVFTKEWGAASPQLFQALVSNEVLKSVVFEFYQTSQTTGADELAVLVKLTNATVVEIHQYGGSAGPEATAKHTASRDAPRLEDVSFTFAGIEIQHVLGKTMAADQVGAR